MVEFAGLFRKGHFKEVVDAIAQNQLVFFLGADINLCGRPDSPPESNSIWEPNGFPPSDSELAVYLDTATDCAYRMNVGCPLCDSKKNEDLPDGCPLKQGVISRMNLEHVSQYVDLGEGGATILYGALSSLFQTNFKANAIHQFLARLPSVMRQKGYFPPYPLIVTSCFDRTLEQAFQEVDQPYDLVSYVGGQHNGYFEHLAPGSPAPRPIKEPNKYQALSFQNWPVILKLYGGYRDFVVTEDHYIDYLAHRDIHDLLPAELLAILEENAILFLGYSLNYWNLRVILHRLWPEQPVNQRTPQWWAIREHAETMEKAIWHRYHSLPIDVDSLSEYIQELEQKISTLPPRHLEAPKPTTLSHPEPTVRDQVFVSYSKEDQNWLDKLKKIIRPAIRSEHCSLWDNTQIEAGLPWQAEVRKALARAKVAVLLVSANFLDSEFIVQEEFPTLLEAAEHEGLKIIWVYLSPCLYQYSAVKDYQPAHDVTQPLSHFSESDQQAILSKVAEKIIDAING